MTSTISTEKFFIDAYNTTILSEERKNLLLKISEGISTEYKKNDVINNYSLFTEVLQKQNIDYLDLIKFFAFWLIILA